MPNEFVLLAKLFVRVVKNYLPNDEESKHCATLLQWDNIYYQEPTQDYVDKKTTVRVGLVKWQMRPYKTLDDVFEQVEMCIRDRLQIAERIVLEDMIHYTMVKSNMFNGIHHPSIAIWHTDNTLEVYKDFRYVSAPRGSRSALHSCRTSGLRADPRA